MTRPSVSVVVPAFNEAEMIVGTLERLVEHLHTLDDRFRWEIVVVDDGSTDATAELAQIYADDHPGVRVLRHRVNFRLGQALLESGQRSEALAQFAEAMAHYRAEQANGATETSYRQDFARALYQLSQAQGSDDVGRAQRRGLLDEALSVLGGLSLEAQQLISSKELFRWVREARQQAGE